MQARRRFHSLAKGAAAAEEKIAGGELSGHCERAALARFERDLLGEHEVSGRQIARRQET